MRMIYLSAPEGYESPNDSMHGKRMFLTLPGFHVSQCPPLKVHNENLQCYRRLVYRLWCQLALP